MIIEQLKLRNNGVSLLLMSVKDMLLNMIQ